VILACYNEAECVSRLAAELEAVLNQLELESEILFINDASTDGTLDILNLMQQQYPRVRVLSHALRCGQSAGQATGFRSARGKQIVTMDADGQNDPRDIPRLLEALQQADAVTGIRRQRHDTRTKRIASRVANAFRNVVTRDQIRDAGCAYRALRREALYEIPIFDGLHRFLPTLLRMQGFRVLELEIAHRPRSGGVSKYGIRDRLWRGLVDCLAMCWLRWRAIPGNRVLSIDPAPTEKGSPIPFAHHEGP
jgi:glycosyltransferase involved in cell wall biosynthesis